jgi:arylsulfatase A-like enzyme
MGRPLKYAVAALLAAVAPVAQAAPVADSGASARPNVIVIMTDDQTFADMSALPRTQSLIGAEGATFNRAYVSYPLCCPSRATFLTGQYAHNNGVRNNAPPHGGVEALNPAHTLAVWLREAGYDTIHIGKYLNGYGLRRQPTVPRGWSEWHGTIDKSTYQMWGYKMYEEGEVRTYGDFDVEDPALYQTDVLRDKAIATIDAHASDPDPFFLSLMFVAPHGEVTRPGGTTQPFVRPAPRHEHHFDTLPVGPSFDDEADMSDKPRYMRKFQPVGATARELIDDDLRARRESLLAVDEAVEQIMQALGRAERLDDTYVIFTSDNGFMQGQHRIRKGKYYAYDPSSHVPLLMRGPGILPGTQSGQLSANTDLAATVLDAANAKADIALDGISLLPFARQRPTRPDRTILHEGLVAGDTDRDNGGERGSGPGAYEAVRTERFLYVHWDSGAKELYDLAKDPLERKSLHRSGRYTAIRRLLSAEVVRMRRCRGSVCNRGLPKLRAATRRLTR